MNRRFRLTKTNDFQRVRRDGQSFAHPLLVLIRLANDQENSRFGVIAGKSIGNAVRRNRVKRRLRSIVAGLIPQIEVHHDVILIARKDSIDASYHQLQQAAAGLMGRAGLLEISESRNSGK